MVAELKMKQIPSPNRPVSGKVLWMDRLRPGRTMSPIRQAEAYWHALLEETGDLPKRSRIDPRALENILADTFILERIAPGLARFRVAGRHLNDLAGMEVRGMPVSAFLDHGDRAEFGAVLEQVFQVPAKAELTLTVDAGRGAAPGKARMILLPLRDDTGAVTRTLGVLLAEAPSPTARPLRLRLASKSLIAADPAQSGMPLPPAEPRPAPEPQGGLAEDQRPLRPRAPHLRLVK